ncbi:hypothetical protein NBRC10513v2_007713 [Rhodotorula toruloides]|uniref:Uncharacterized protein n=1 Tax=Rhodotorula toruloides TaxID=5286 RepID=A0A2T0ABS6_RHOTO|nr:hypothetical protein AAT19DRAFT_13514 [Rhodotorula toruloides]
MPPSSSSSSSRSSSPPPEHGGELGSDKEVREKFDKDLGKYLNRPSFSSALPQPAPEVTALLPDWERIRDLVKKTPSLKGLLELLGRLHVAGSDAVEADTERDAWEEEGGEEYHKAVALANTANKLLRDLSQQVAGYKDPIARRVIELWDEADDLHGELSQTVEELFDAKRKELEAHLSDELEDANERIDHMKKHELRLDKQGPPKSYKRKRNPYVSHEEEDLHRAKSRGSLLKHAEAAPHSLSKNAGRLGYRQALRHFGVGY